MAEISRKNELFYQIISKQSKCETVYKSEDCTIDLMYIILCGSDKTAARKHLNNMHSHSMYEFHMVRSGEFEFTMEDGRRILVPKNHFIIIPPSLKHNITKESDDFRKLLMSFDFAPNPDSESDMYKNAALIMKTPAVYKSSPLMTKLFNVIYDLSKSDSHGKSTMIFQLAVCYIMEIFNLMLKKKSIVKLDTPIDKRVESAIKFIKDNISNPITASDVAKSVYLSPKQLSRMFVEATGQTTAKYIRMTKNEYICKLLAETNLSLADIAELSGIPDSAALIKRFKRIEGNTPKKYKQSIIKKSKINPI